MTTIAWDGRILASDKRATNGNGQVLITTKIYRIGGSDENIFKGCLFATSGDVAAGRLMLEWFKRGGKTAKFPDRQRDKDNRSTILVVSQHGELMYFLDSPVPMLPEQNLFTLGSGGEYAMGAMKMGASAIEAVKIACECDCYSGNGIDFLTLEAP